MCRATIPYKNLSVSIHPLDKTFHEVISETHEEESHSYNVWFTLILPINVVAISGELKDLGYTSLTYLFFRQSTGKLIKADCSL